MYQVILQLGEPEKTNIACRISSGEIETFFHEVERGKNASKSRVCAKGEHPRLISKRIFLALRISAIGA